MTWTYNGEDFESTDGYVGMVYLITNETSGMMYVGKKLFSRSKTTQKNLKKKRTRVESDWVNYTGSKKLLNEEIAEGAVIKKEILHLCTSKGWMSYRETQEILNREAMQSDKYYNGWISCKIHGKHLK